MSSHILWLWILRLPGDSSERSSSNLCDLVVRKVKSSHESHPPKRIRVQSGDSVPIQMKHSQHAVTSKHPARHLKIESKLD